MNDKKVTREFFNVIESVEFYVEDKEKQETVGEIYFQNGPIKKNGVNGVQVRDIIDMLIERVKNLDAKQNSEFNQKTIEYLLLAELEQDKRTKDREKRNVEGEDKL